MKLMLYRLCMDIILVYFCCYIFLWCNFHVHKITIGSYYTVSVILIASAGNNGIFKMVLGIIEVK